MVFLVNFAESNFRLIWLCNLLTSILCRSGPEFKTAIFKQMSWKTPWRYVSNSGSESCGLILWLMVRVALLVWFGSSFTSFDVERMITILKFNLPLCDVYPAQGGYKAVLLHDCEICSCWCGQHELTTPRACSNFPFLIESLRILIQNSSGHIIFGDQDNIMSDCFKWSRASTSSHNNNAIGLAIPSASAVRTHLSVHPKNLWHSVPA